MVASLEILLYTIYSPWPPSTVFRPQPQKSFSGLNQALDIVNGYPKSRHTVSLAETIDLCGFYFDPPTLLDSTVAISGFACPHTVSSLDKPHVSLQP